MTNAQKLAVRLSEIRQRLNEIAGLEGDAVTDEIRAEADTLTTEYQSKETQHRAALVVEADEQRAAAGEFGNADGEPAEVRALMGRVNLGEYLGAAAAGIGLSGAPVELASALEVPAFGGSGGIAIPWAVLAAGRPEPRQAPDPEGRAFTTTAAYGGPIMQRPILQRLFGRDIMDALGVRIDTVPAGRTEWPLITGGVAPDMKAEGTAADAAVSAAFSTETLKPKRLTGRYEFTHEMNAQVLDLEQALRRDLADSVMSKMNDLILNGDEATNAQEPDGFLTTIAAPTDPTAQAAYSDYAKVAASAVDGIHAVSEREVGIVLGVETYRHAAGVFQTGSGEAGTEAMMKRSRAVMASSFVPDAAGANTIQDGNLLHAGGDAMRGDSVAAVWPTLEVIRDIYSQASQGVVLTWVTLWDAQTAFRSAAYKRIAFRLA